MSASVAARLNRLPPIRTHRRATIIVLTEKGTAATAAALHAAATVEREWQAALGPSNLALLRSSLEALIAREP